MVLQGYKEAVKSLAHDINVWSCLEVPDELGDAKNEKNSPLKIVCG